MCTLSDTLLRTFFSPCFVLFFMCRLKARLKYYCMQSKAVLSSPVCSVQTLRGDMGRRYTFYRCISISSREDLYER